MPETATIKFPSHLYLTRGAVAIEWEEPEFLRGEGQPKVTKEVAAISTHHFVFVRELSDSIGLYKDANGFMTYRIRISETKGAIAHV